MECTWNDLWVAKDQVERQGEFRYMKERR